MKGSPRTVTDEMLFTGGSVRSENYGVDRGVQLNALTGTGNFVEGRPGYTDKISPIYVNEVNTFGSLVT